MRYLQKYIQNDLNNGKMVLLAGPRQVGKTTFSFCFLSNINAEAIKEDHQGYLNWDIPSKRKTILANELPVTETIVFDEIHKYKDWRNYLKGVYDLHKARLKILVTGSAKLDLYRRSGDSLQGRYFFYRLHPLSPAEINYDHQQNDNIQNDHQQNDNNQKVKSEEESFDRLIEYGGFPEPFYQQDKIFWQRWQNLRQKRLIEEDLIYLEQVKDLSNIEILMTILPARVGSLLSYNSLREDLNCSHAAVKNWMRILENLYFHYTITPYTGTALKSIKKEAKLFLWDWSLAEGKGKKYENFVASMLFKYCHFREDIYGEKLSLHFFRAKDKREVDFIVCNNNKPLFAVECKSNSTNLAKSFVSMRAHFKDIPFYQTHTNKNNKHYIHDKTGIEVLPLFKFIKNNLSL